MIEALNNLQHFLFYTTAGGAVLLIGSGVLFAGLLYFFWIRKIT